MSSAPTRPAAELDALELEIFRYATTSVVDELEVNLTRTAYSELIFEYKDYSVGVLTRGFDLLTQSEGSIPLFVADLGPQVRDAVGVIGEANLREGDIFISNYAAANGQHLNNVTCASPIFQEGEIAGYVAIRAHWMDIGGIAPTSNSWDATDIFQEGIQYRGLRVVREGEIVPEVMATIEANTRMPRETAGDLMAQISACTLGRQRWQSRVASRWNLLELAELTRRQSEWSARLAEDAVAALPDGVYEASCRMDDSGAADTPPLELHVRVVVDGARLRVDFSSMPPQVKAPINAGISGGATGIARCAFKMLFAPDRPADEWLFMPLEVEIPEGTVLSATGTAAMGFWNYLPATVIDLIFRAIGEQLPERVPAGHHATLGACAFTGRDAAGRLWIMVSSGAGGFGGHRDGNGFSPLRTLWHGDNNGSPIELIEALYPLRIRSHRYWREAAGRGLHNGGYGTERIYETLAPVAMITSLDRTLDPPWGLNGGQAAQTGSIEILRPGSTTWESKSRVTQFPLEPGTVVRQRHAGGGGWGAPGDEEDS